MRRKEILIEIGELALGKTAKKILELLLNEGEMTDEDIAKITGMSVNDVRRTLHKLFEMRLVKYRRMRDPKVGWYTYFWRVTDERPEIVIEQRKKKVINKLKELLTHEAENTFFICNRCNIRYTYNEALSNMFQCVKCKDYLEEYDNSKLVNTLKRLIKYLNNLRIE